LLTIHIFGQPIWSTNFYMQNMRHYFLIFFAVIYLQAGLYSCTEKEGKQ